MSAECYNTFLTPFSTPYILLSDYSSKQQAKQTRMALTVSDIVGVRQDNSTCLLWKQVWQCYLMFLFIMVSISSAVWHTKRYNNRYQTIILLYFVVKMIQYMIHMRLYKVMCSLFLKSNLPVFVNKIYVDLKCCERILVHWSTVCERRNRTYIDLSAWRCLERPIFISVYLWTEITIESNVPITVSFKCFMLIDGGQKKSMRNRV